MRRLVCVMTILGVGLAGAVVAAGPAGAATSITTPSTNPFAVPGTAGSPNPFTVSASGFAASASVFIEQCDGVSPTSVGWDPTINCDLGTSPAAALADGSGNVTFAAADANHAFHPFKGASPQGLFNCLSLNDPSPNNGLLDHRTCTVRVSTNNSAATADQVFLTMVLPDDPSTVPPPPLRIGIGNVSVLEGNAKTRAATFTVSLSRKSVLPVTVDYATVAGTATAGSDFTARTGQHLTIAAGSTSAAIAVQVKGDGTTEPNETFKVHLSNPTSGAGIKRGNGTATILNDDPPRSGIRVGIGNASLLEGNSAQPHAAVPGLALDVDDERGEGPLRDDRRDRHRGHRLHDEVRDAHHRGREDLGPGVDHGQGRLDRRAERVVHGQADQPGRSRDLAADRDRQHHERRLALGTVLTNDADSRRLVFPERARSRQPVATTRSPGVRRLRALRGSDGAIGVRFVRNRAVRRRASGAAGWS